MFHFVKHIFSLIRFSHTLFALPFALASMFIAAEGPPPLRVFLLILACMVTGRTAGMAFNRYMDAEIDARNPRTAGREIPKGVVGRRFTLGLSLGSAALFVVAASLINPLCMKLSPVALFILFFYSLTKRFTSLSHLLVGLALGISPVGAWIAVTGRFAPLPILLGTAVIFWVAGFDIIYATQDVAFDHKEGLHSLVVSLGLPRALLLSRLFHVITLVLFILVGVRLHGLSGMAGRTLWGYWLSLILCAFLLGYEHMLVRPNDLSRINAAFFEMNGYISIVFLAGVVLSIL